MWKKIRTFIKDMIIPTIIIFIIIIIAIAILSCAAFAYLQGENKATGYYLIVFISLFLAVRYEINTYFNWEKCELIKYKNPEDEINIKKKRAISILYSYMYLTISLSVFLSLIVKKIELGAIFGAAIATVICFAANGLILCAMNYLKVQKI